MPNSKLLQETIDWVAQNNQIKSAMLFGSTASGVNLKEDLPSAQSDLDLQLIVSDTFTAEEVDWKKAAPSSQFYFQASRVATGGVRKVTVIFDTGQIDMVVVPIRKMRLAAMGLRLNIHKRVGSLRIALNEIATCLHTGYRILKGGALWRRFYDDVSRLDGVRLSLEETRSLADASVCDALWVFQKLLKGELIAAQHVLHTRLSDANLRLWREARRRKDLPLPSFGLGRHVEKVAPDLESKWLGLSSRLDVHELQHAAFQALQTLKALMEQLDSAWCISRPMDELLSNYRRG